MKDVLVDPLQHFIATFVVHAKKLGKECDSALEVYENSMSKYASRSKRDTQLAEVCIYISIHIHTLIQRMARKWQRVIFDLFRYV